MMILSPADLLVRWANEYPTMYAGASYDEAKFKMLDHILNVVGNDISIKDFRGLPVTDTEREAAQKWFSARRVMVGYRRSESDRYRRSESDPWAPSVSLENKICSCLPEEQDKYPQVNLWLSFECPPKAPYPNFDKKYSVVWRRGFQILGPEWAAAAVWYYQTCREYFLSDAVASYSWAYPKPTPAESAEFVDEYKQTLSRYQTSAEISAAYEVEFVGDPRNDDDVAAFIVRRWDVERQRILGFIDETLNRLTSG